MRAAALLLALLLAGCVSPAPGSAGFQEVCLGLPMGVEWRQPGLHEALPEAARGAGLAATETAPSDGFAFLDPPPGLEGARLVSVLHFPLGERGPLSPMVAVEVEPGGAARAFVWEARDEAQARAAFRAFLEAVDLGDAPGAREWERALLAGRVEQPWSVHHEARLGLPLSADAVHASALREASLEAGGETGTLVLQAPRWQLVLRTPTRSVVLGEGFERLRLSADASGRVHGESVFADKDAGSDALLARLQEGFGRLGLPEPTFLGLAPGRARC